jgi:class 3 adenylate cyclase
MKLFSSWTLYASGSQMERQMKPQIVENITPTHRDSTTQSGSLPGMDTDGLFSGYTNTFSHTQPTNLERREVAILYADIVDYARLTEQDEDGTHLRVVNCMKVIHDLARFHQGRIAHLAGDAILAEFKDADGALRCAISFQLATRKWNVSLNSQEWIRFRVGINFGEVITDHGDIYGQAVNLAARLESLASSGGICVSSALRENLESQSHFNFVDLGKRYLKNISEPVEVFWICYDDRESGGSVSADVRSAFKKCSEKFLRLSGLLPALVNPGFFHNNAGD